ncbi:MAG: helix-turn-helix domain-containing protein [Novosphingobium aromaticivorans]|nr:helix-turn-helix domain-containing protein [Novosphingobium aromaticivorans]
MPCNSTPAQPGHLQPLAYSISEACRVSSLGKTYLYALIKDGKLTSRKVGNRTLILADSLRRLIEEGA